FHESAWQAVEWPARAAAPVHAALPAPDALDGLETSAVWAARFGLDGYDAYRGQIEQACAGIVADTLAELGHDGADVGDGADSADSADGADMQPAGIAAAMAEIAPAQRRLFAHLLAVRGRG
ncbi:hypothetical protein XF14_37025, partial [Burkholderia gladioli]